MKNSRKENTEEPLFLYGSIIIGIVLVITVMGITKYLIKHENRTDMIKTINALNASMVIMQREDCIRCIPNICTFCNICGEDDMPQAVLVCVNLGKIYTLNLYGNERDSEIPSGMVQVMFGYDEISQANIHILKYPKRKEVAVRLFWTHNIINICKMKLLYCDDCIEKILVAIKNKPIKGFVIFGTASERFYALETGSIKIGEHEIKIVCKGKNCEIKIKI